MNAATVSDINETTKQIVRILCVDDEPNVLNALKRILRSENYEVITAADAEEGLNLIERFPVNLVISDMILPDMVGAEFLKYVKTLYPDTIRILLTGYADVPTIQDVVRESESHFIITKPWNDDALKINISKALNFNNPNKPKPSLTKTGNLDPIPQ